MPQENLTFDEFLDKLRHDAKNTRDKGEKFEVAMVALLPQLVNYEFEEAWLWRDWPKREAITGLNAQDIGIDIVARIRDSDEYWAIQCKFYDPETTITHGDLGTFFTASGRRGFSGRLIITTTDKWTKHAENMTKDQHIEAHRLRLNDLRKLHIGWNWVRPDQTRVLPETRKSLKKRQQEALDTAKDHYKINDRGQLIMACGTGKTFTSLKIAEQLTPENGFVLFVVPSLSLIKQTIHEWAWERERDARYLAICSDSTVGGFEDNTHLADISVPVSTDPSRIANHLSLPTKNERMTVVFSTYQSLDQLSLAQKRGAPEFDMIICDEAHRTTGVDKEKDSNPDQKNSNFVRIHDQDFIQGKKRLYMTATPRIYAEAAIKKASALDVDVYSMNDEKQFGSEFYRLGFGQAVSEGLLSDYRVIVLNIAQGYVTDLISKLDKDIVKSLDPKTDDVAKIIGCYKALRDQGKGDEGKMLKRAVSFSNNIKNSKQVVDKFSHVVKALDELENDGFTCELDHVDGKQTALFRASRLDWLREDAAPTEDGEVCRILSNARCLTEGVDVPSLDAVMFMNPRKSQVDVVQAVGRVMRKAKGKDYGYVILPIVIPDGEDIEKALDKNETFGVVWEVLRALRAHDERFNNEISKLELNKNKPDNFDLIGIGFAEGEKEISGGLKPFQMTLSFPEELAGLIYAKIVDKVGDKGYLEKWAKDTAELHDLLVQRIDELRAHQPAITSLYDEFLQSLKASIHDGLDSHDASSMLAQQLITKPVFDVLFEDYQFSQNNVVSTALNEMLGHLAEFGLERELEGLKAFYKSVADRVSGLDNDEARQKVITELYEKFFTTAFPKTAESLGIAYTPIELVDFTLKSADVVMRDEFGRGLSDEGVHIIDPFTGTGSFLVRLLNNPELIKDSDLHRKFTGELWANEILLLAYYIASVNIEMAYHQRGGRQYQSFPGISLTDSFELYERNDTTLPAMLAVNSERISAQRNAPIRVVVGNPPWSAGQQNQNDNNANRVYEVLDESIRQSYAKRSKATNNNSNYDSYIRAIRWASDRIGEEGLVAYVTNGGWLDSASADGIRLSLEEEFDAIWVFNLRGNIRKNIQSKGAAKEGQNVFGQKTQNTVCVSLFIKNPTKPRLKAEINYSNIGDDLKSHEKLSIISTAGSITRLDRREVFPNEEGDWINQRDPMFSNFVELGNDDVKRGKVSQPETMFRSYSRGAETTRDAWAYNFSCKQVVKNMERMIDVYNEQCARLQSIKDVKEITKTEDVLLNDSTQIKWSSSLISYADRNIQGQFDELSIRESLYRPFDLEYLYLDPMFTHRKAKMFEYFPTSATKNCLICVTGKGSSSEFSCLMSDAVPCLDMLEKGQTFPRWVYREDEVTGEMIREDNITNYALEYFKSHYKDDGITKDRIFDYVYGILHAPDYRERFATDLRLSLPRIPMAQDFWAFADAGAALADYHLNWSLDGHAGYRTELGYLFDGEVTFTEMIPEDAYKVNKMRWVEHKGKKYIQYSTHLRIGPIPEEALRYTIGNKTPLDWIIDRYQVKTDKASGIVNDANDWIKEQSQSDALIELIKRVTYLSIETDRIIKSLPKSLDEAQMITGADAGAKVTHARRAQEHPTGSMGRLQFFRLEGQTEFNKLNGGGQFSRQFSPNQYATGNRYLNVTQNNPSSFFITLDFAFPQLDADHITATPFASTMIEELLEPFKIYQFHDEQNVWQFAISDIAIYCRDGSKKGKLQFVIKAKAASGAFLYGLGKTLEGLASVISALNEVETPAAEIIEKAIEMNWSNIAMIVHNPDDQAGGYIIPQAKTSKILDPENATAMIGKDDLGRPLIAELPGSNEESVIIHYRRESQADDFKRVDNN